MQAPLPEGFIMRRLLVCLVFALVLVMPVLAQPDAKAPYKIDFNPNDVEQRSRSKEGREGIYIAVRFGISAESKEGNANEGDWQIVIEENGKKAAAVPLPEVKTVTTGLSVIMAIDTSGSMREHNRM